MMDRNFEDGAIVRMSDDIIASAPAYAERLYTIRAATTEWEIGRYNEWCGDYIIEDECGNKAVARQSCLVLA